MKKLLSLFGVVSIHNKNMPLVGTEIIKIIKGGSHKIMEEIFHDRDKGFFQLKRRSCFCIPSVNSVFRNTKSIKFLGSNVWDHEELH